MASRIRRSLLLSVVVGSLSGALAGPALATSADEGRAIFEQACSSCHTVGQGDKVGPDLAGVAQRRDREWLTRFILDPAAVIASGDPVATELVSKYGVQMPSLGLTQDQVASLVAFFEAQSGGGQAAPPAAGEADVGKSLFTGSDRLENGGPPCMSCHTVAGIGSLGGGKVGPDLTQAYAKYGKGLPATLTNVAFPTMQPIFAGRPITDQEAADLAAFLAQAPEAKRPAGAVGKLVGLALGGAAVLVALAFLLWRRRPTAVREPLVARSNLRRK